MSDEKDLLEVLDEATRAYLDTEAAHKTARDSAIAAVVAALKAGKRPTDVAARSPFTDAYVRRVAREHGVGPRKKGEDRGTS